MKFEIWKLLLDLSEVIDIEQLSFRAASIPIVYFTTCFQGVKQME